MSAPWNFVPNTFADVWLSPDDPTTDPPTFVSIDCQQMKPYFVLRSSLGAAMVHRFILRLTDTGNLGSTALVAGMWILVKTFAGDNIGWYTIGDVSPMAYVDPVNGPTWEFVMYSGFIATF
jgi:hypothetical protein